MVGELLFRGVDIFNTLIIKDKKANLNRFDMMLSCTAKYN